MRKINNLKSGSLIENSFGYDKGLIKNNRLIKTTNLSIKLNL